MRIKTIGFHAPAQRFLRYKPFVWKIVENSRTRYPKHLKQFFRPRFGVQPAGGFPPDSETHIDPPSVMPPGPLTQITTPDNLVDVYNDPVPPLGNYSGPKFDPIHFPKTLPMGRGPGKFLTKRGYYAALGVAAGATALYAGAALGAGLLQLGNAKSNSAARTRKQAYERYSRNFQPISPHSSTKYLPPQTKTSQAVRSPPRIRAIQFADAFRLATRVPRPPSVEQPPIVPPLSQFKRGRWRADERLLYENRHLLR